MRWPKVVFRGRPLLVEMWAMSACAGWPAPSWFVTVGSGCMRSYTSLCSALEHVEKSRAQLEALVLLPATCRMFRL